MAIQELEYCCLQTMQLLFLRCVLGHYLAVGNKFLEDDDVVGGCETKINEILNTLSAI